MSPAIIAVVSIVLGVLVVLLLLQMLTRAVLARATELANRHYEPEEMLLMEPMANFFGVQSKGALQGRGNGALVLTESDLHFLMLVGDELRVPLADVREVTTVKSHLGKTIGRPLLHVRYAVGDREDSVAWFVADVPRWKEAIEAHRPR